MRDYVTVRDPDGYEMRGVVDALRDLAGDPYLEVYAGREYGTILVAEDTCTLYAKQESLFDTL